MKVRTILQVKESLLLGQYVGYAICGILQYLKSQMLKDSNFELQNQVVPKIDKIQKLFNETTYAVFLLYKYVTPYLSLVGSLTINASNNPLKYLDQAKPDSKLLPTLLKELLMVFIRIVNSSQSVPHGSSHKQVSVLNMAYELVEEMRNLSERFQGAVTTRGFYAEQLYAFRMQDTIFGNYLLHKGAMNKDILQQVTKIQNQSNKPLASVAEECGFLTAPQVKQLLSIQKKQPRTFAQLALQHNMLSQKQIEKILTLQRQKYISLRDILASEMLIPEMLLDQEWSIFNQINQSILQYKNIDTQTAKNLWIAFPQKVLRELQDLVAFFGKQFSSTSVFYLQERLMPMKELVTTAYHNHKFIPPFLWEEMWQMGIFSGQQKDNDLEHIVQNSRYVRDRGETYNERIKKMVNFIREKLLVYYTEKPQSPFEGVEALFPQSTTCPPLRIVILDDDELLGTLVKTMLTAIGHDVTCFTDPQAMLAELPNLQPELLLLDYYLENTDGLSILKIVKQKIPELPVLLITVSHSPEIGGKAVKLGAHGCLDKPFTGDSLVAKIEEAYQESVAITGWSCRGNLSSTPIIEVLQICSTTRQTGALNVVTGNGNMSIDFVDGEIVNAHIGAISGFKALVRIALQQQGSFNFQTEDKTKGEETIHFMDTAILLIELTRQCDEINRLETKLPQRQQPLVALNDQQSEDPLWQFIHENAPITLQEILDSTDANDLDILQAVDSLLSGNYICVQEAKT